MRILNRSNFFMSSGLTSSIKWAISDAFVCAVGTLGSVECGSRDDLLTGRIRISVVCLGSGGIRVLGLSQESVRVVGDHARLRGGDVGSLGRRWRRVSTCDVGSEGSEFLGLSQESVRVVGDHARLRGGSARRWRRASTSDAGSDVSDLFLDRLHCRNGW